MLSKKFDQALHDEFDELGREMSKRFYKRFGFDLKDNPDQYGIDLIAYRMAQKEYFFAVPVDKIRLIKL